MSLFITALLFAAQEVKPPRVEVVFVLDTTGSMGGLLEGAKRKIWAITNQMAQGKPTPDLHVGLVAYRDKGDAYVTKVTDLTDDLDAVYTELTTFKADGGGDGPENVRQALHDAITKVKWSKDAVKILFLVGDAPPHDDYDDVPKTEALCESAVKSDLIINAVRCGGDENTGRVWQEIAKKSEGDYFSIDQDGGVAAVATPFDKELGELSDKIGSTLVAYGSAAPKAAEAEEAAKSMPAESKADRAAAKGYLGRMSEGDLVDAVTQKRIKLEEVKDAELPEEMKKMTLDERKAHVEKKGKERAELQEKVKDLSKKREAYIAEEIKKLGAKDAFDQVVLESLRKQLKKSGVEFPK